METVEEDMEAMLFNLVSVSCGIRFRSALRTMLSVLTMPEYTHSQLDPLISGPVRSSTISIVSVKGRRDCGMP